MDFPIRTLAILSTALTVATSSQCHAKATCAKLFDSYAIQADRNFDEDQVLKSNRFFSSLSQGAVQISSARTAAGQFKEGMRVALVIGLPGPTQYGFRVLAGEVVKGGKDRLVLRSGNKNVSVSMDNITEVKVFRFADQSKIKDQKIDYDADETILKATEISDHLIAKGLPLDPRTFNDNRNSLRGARIVVNQWGSVPGAAGMVAVGTVDRVAGDRILLIVDGTRITVQSRYLISAALLGF